MQTIEEDINIRDIHKFGEVEDAYYGKKGLEPFVKAMYRKAGTVFFLCSLPMTVKLHSVNQFT